MATYIGFLHILMKFFIMRAHILLNEKQVDHLEPVQLESAVSEAQASLADSCEGNIQFS